MTQKIELYPVWDPRNYMTELVGFLICSVTSYFTRNFDEVIHFMFIILSLVFFLWLIKSVFDEMKRDKVRQEKKSAKVTRAKQQE